MAPYEGKRKRVEILDDTKASKKASSATNGISKGKKQQPAVQPVNVKPNGRMPTVEVAVDKPDSALNIQIVTGSYERVLHGFSAAIPRTTLTSNSDTAEDIQFSETFLFAAHTSSIRCLAVSPPTENDKRFLATGGSDERINVYSVSTVPTTSARSSSGPTLNGTVIAENTSNRSLGSLVHHDRAITRLEFPTKSKLFSAAEDNTVAISRTRDWTVLSSIKAPIPKPQGRPSGDTAAPGEIPAGINDFAIHPSQKLMLSVSRGERCMRLWNLMTGKKAGVLNFDRDLTTQAGEGKYSSGEGRRVLWDAAGESFVVGFERGAAVFNIESQPKATIKPNPSTKLHQYRFVHNTYEDHSADLLTISTEDGRILFFDLANAHEQTEAKSTLPIAPCIAQLGGRSTGIPSRIKDFELVQLPTSATTEPGFIAVTAGSDGSIRLWSVLASELADAGSSRGDPPKQIGRLFKTHETTNRITCLGAFIMDGSPRSVTQSNTAKPSSVEEDDDEESDEEEDGQ